MNKENYPIDFVVSWVDGDNAEWLAEKEKYNPSALTGVDVRKRRFRNWYIFQYWFRAVEAYAPWVNKIYIVTPGHYPEWLNLNHPKIVLIDQNILLDEKNRPSFNNCAIELYLHRIPGLSEHFVYFCDDMFLTNPVTPRHFFRKGLPLDSVGFTALGVHVSDDGKTFYGIPARNLCLVAKHFCKNKVFKQNWKKFLDLRNGKYVLRTLAVSPFSHFTGINEPHTANSYLRSTYVDLWNRAEEDLQDTINARFRQEYGLSQWGVRYWQICMGNFNVRSVGFFESINVKDTKTADKAIRMLSDGKQKVLCLNDDVKDIEYEAVKEMMQTAFEEKLPHKSSFEV